MGEGLGKGHMEEELPKLEPQLVKQKSVLKSDSETHCITPAIVIFVPWLSCKKLGIRDVGPYSPNGAIRSNFGSAVKFMIK